MRQLLILSGKGGTGKTTVATAFIHLAKARAYADCDVDAPNLHLLNRPKSDVEESEFYGMDKAEINAEKCVGCDICHINCRFNAIQKKEDTKLIVDPFACEGCGICARLCPVEAVEMKPHRAGRLFLYSGEETFSAAKLNMGSGTSGLLVTEVKKRLKKAPETIPFAIIDGSPGIGCPVIASVSGVDLVLVVAEPSLSGFSDMERILKTATQLQAAMAVCINKFDINQMISDEIETYCWKHSIPFVGKIPFDEGVVEAINKGQSIVERNTSAGQAVEAVYKRTIHLLMKDETLTGNFKVI